MSEVQMPLERYHEKPRLIEQANESGANTMEVVVSKLEERAEEVASSPILTTTLTASRGH